ncbi:unnamed protein product [Ascophyllum nodosum]
MLETTVVLVTPARKNRGKGGIANKTSSWIFPVAITLASSSLAFAVTSTAIDQTDVEGSNSSSVGGDIDTHNSAISNAEISVTDGGGQAFENAGNTLGQVLASADGNAAAMSIVESFLASINALLAEYGMPSASVLCAALAVPILAFALVGKFGIGGGRNARGGLASNRRKGVVLFLGPCGSGKTAMCYRLSKDVFAPTVTSMQACTYDCKKLTPSSKLSASLIDYPGHERLRGGVREELQRADRLVFVLDGSCLSAQIAAGAELLYDVLTDTSVEGCRGLLLALNKSDLREAKASRAKVLLQKEIEKLRLTRGTLGAQGEEDDMPATMTLGRPGQPFSLEVDSPCEVAIATCSVMKEGGLGPIEDFIRASVR